MDDSTTRTRTAPITIRRATNDDVNYIASLGERIFTETFGYSMPAKDLAVYLENTYTMQALSKTLVDPQQTVMVATCPDPNGHTLAGFLVLRRGSSEPCIASQPRPIELLRLYVDAPFHGTGVAKALMHSGEDLARQEGCESMWLGVWEDNLKAQRFYQKLGFEKFGDHDFVMGECVQTDLIMAKRF